MQTNRDGKANSEKFVPQLKRTLESTTDRKNSKLAVTPQMQLTTINHSINNKNAHEMYLDNETITKPKMETIKYSRTPHAYNQEILRKIHNLSTQSINPSTPLKNMNISCHGRNQSELRENNKNSRNKGLYEIPNRNLDILNTRETNRSIDLTSNRRRNNHLLIQENKEAIDSFINKHKQSYNYSSK